VIFSGKGPVAVGGFFQNTRAIVNAVAAENSTLFAQATPAYHSPTVSRVSFA
jgi:hypothetical protein